MPTLAIVGAGPGLGLSIANVFGSRGFSIALVSRDATHLRTLVDELRSRGVTAHGFAADITDRPSVTRTFADIKAVLGMIDVLEFSPGRRAGPGFENATALEVSVENVAPQIEFYVYGAIAVTQQVLPDMIAAGRGTLIYSTGGSSVNPRPWLANLGVAGAALRNWALSLRIALADQGIYVAHVPIGTFIGGSPDTEAEVIARAYWDLYQRGEAADRSFVWWDRDPGIEFDVTRAQPRVLPP